jgi:hypothetical protein
MAPAAGHGSTAISFQAPVLQSTAAADLIVGTGAATRPAASSTARHRRRRQVSASPAL